ncbi:alpha/beta fold hydrolase [uncultured Gulosibacter sp.]|uniref:alpha/beta hydrolase family protein n=1 Tax=uncultured Gulosibacter sp. TaxID=1339167 RepID=UPI00288BD082|nr:alpha/beta fold hydrolase [uncultured Gulosibacter sp.]
MKQQRTLQAATAAAAGAAAFAGALVGTIALSLARQVVTLPSKPREPVRVVEIRPDRDAGATGGTVVLERTIESHALGEFTMLWAQGRGRARLLERLETTERTVTRRYRDVRGTEFSGVRAVRLASAPQLGVEDLGLPWSEVAIPGEGGELPGWFIPAAAESSDWCIHIHGRGATLTEPLRTVPLVAERGWHSLVMQYRNDPGAPTGQNGKTALGLTEWRDVDAALEWAKSRGARRVVLVGWSMGGAIAVQAALRSVHADMIVGLMLESPALDWYETLIWQAGRLNVPPSIAKLGIRLLGSPLARPLLGTEGPLDLTELDVVARAPQLRWPTLVLASTGDTVVPVSGSQRLAKARPDLVTYEEFTSARHTRLWNTDPDRWEAVVGKWFDRLATQASDSLVHGRVV